MTRYRSNRPLAALVAGVLGLAALPAAAASGGDVFVDPGALDQLGYTRDRRPADGRTLTLRPPPDKQGGERPAARPAAAAPPVQAAPAPMTVQPAAPARVAATPPTPAPTPAAPPPPVRTVAPAPIPAPAPVPAAPVAAPRPAPAPPATQPAPPPPVATAPTRAAPPAPVAVPAPATPAPQTASLAPPTVTQRRGEARIAFPAGGTDLPAGARGELDRMAGRLSADEALRVQLNAYAAESGDQSSQARRLSLSRALAVRAYLIDKGVRSTRLDVRALGQPQDDGPADRVDLVVVGR